MSRNYRNENTSRPSNGDLPVHVIEQIIENQKQQLFLQSQDLKLREKELEVNSKLAEKEMTFQADLLKNRPGETRKTIRIITIAVISFVALFLLFFGYCIYSGHESFALKIFGYIMYGVTTVAGYWAGKRTKGKQLAPRNNEMTAAEIVNDP